MNAPAPLRSSGLFLPRTAEQSSGSIADLHSLSTSSPRWFSELHNREFGSTRDDNFETVVTPPLSRHVTLVALELSRPVEVLIEDDGDGVAVSHAATGIFGAGDTLNNALQDFVTALRDHSVVLSSESELSSQLSVQQQFLRELLVSEGI